MKKAAAPQPDYYQPQEQPAAAKPLKEPSEIATEDVTQKGVKAEQQRALYFAEKETAPSGDTKSLYTGTKSSDKSLAKK